MSDKLEFHQDSSRVAINNHISRLGELNREELENPFVKIEYLEMLEKVSDGRLGVVENGSGGVEVDLDEDVGVIDEVDVG